MNLLMCIATARLLPAPLLLAYLRSSGVGGAEVIMELDKEGCIPFVEDVEREELLSDAAVEECDATSLLLAHAPVSLLPGGDNSKRIVKKLRVSVKASLCLNIYPSEHFPKGPVDLNADPPTEANPVLVVNQVITHCLDLLQATDLICAIGAECVTFDGGTCKPDFATLPPKFLLGCKMVEAVVFPKSWKFQTVGVRVFGTCRLLLSIDLPELIAMTITSIPNHFINECSYLPSISLASLVNVTTIGDSFLADNWKLRSVDLTPMESIRSIGSDFLCGCAKIESINLGPLYRIRKVPESFLRDCTSLKAIDVIPLSNAEEIGMSFLCGCESLVELDLTPLVMALDEDTPIFTSRCSSLRMVRIPTGAQLFVNNNENIEFVSEG